LSRAKKPFLRVTKWLSGTIPVEAECTACSGTRFAVEWSSLNTLQQASRDSCAQQLQQQFDQHAAAAHSEKPPPAR